MKALLLLLLAPLAAPLAAQGVLIAPTAVFVDARVRTGSLLLVNPNDEPAEIEIGTLYGYPVTDSLGRISLHTIEQPDSTEPSAAGWVRIFPRRVTIAPKAQQTVRLLVSPPPNIPDREYWARLVITARGGHVPLATQGDTTGVTVGLTVEVRTIIPLLYRKGKPSTAPVLSALRAARDGDSLVVRAKLSREGNAALLATVRGELVDSTGRVRGGFLTPISAYYPIEPRFTLSVDTIPPGSYRLRVEVASHRQDLPPDVLLPFRLLRDSVAVQLP